MGKTDDNPNQLQIAAKKSLRKPNWKSQRDLQVVDQAYKALFGDKDSTVKKNLVNDNRVLELLRVKNRAGRYNALKQVIEADMPKKWYDITDYERARAEAERNPTFQFGEHLRKRLSAYNENPLMNMEQTPDGRWMCKDCVDAAKQKVRKPKAQKRT